MNNDFMLQIKAIFDKNGISTEFEKIKKTISSDPAVIKITTDATITKKAVKDLAYEIHDTLSKAFVTNGINDFNLSIKEIESIISGSLKQAQKESIQQQKQLTKEAEQTRKEYEKLQSASSKKSADNQATRIKESNSLLQEQRSEYQSIWAINEKIAKLNPDKNSTEISSLQEEQKYHQANYLALQKQISTYNDVVDNQARVNSLLEISKQKQLEINNIKSKQSDSSSSQYAKDVEEAYAENERYNQRQIAQQKELVLAREQADKINQSITQKEIAQKKELYLAEEQAYKTNQKYNQSLSNLSLDKTKTSSQISMYMRENTKLTEDFIIRLKQMDKELDNVDATGLKNIQKEFATLKSEATAQGVAGKSLFSNFVGDIKNFATFIGAGGVIMGAVNTVREMVSNVYELDSAMTSLKKVTSNTNAEYSNFLDNAIVKSKELATSLATYVEQTAEWSKAGYNLVDSANLAEISTIFRNVGDVDAETSVNDIVTALKAYNLEASKAITVVDALNEVDNNFAVSSSGIGDGLRNSASALSLAGNDINKSIAMLTGMTEITQDASESGNAIKVLSMRLRGMKGDLEDIGEEYEDIQSVSKIQSQIYNLTQGTVNIMDDADPTKFKSTYEIIQGIAKVYNDLSQTDQASLLEIIAGKVCQYVQKCA